MRWLLAAGAGLWVLAFGGPMTVSLVVEVLLSLLISQAWPARPSTRGLA